MMKNPDTEHYPLKPYLQKTRSAFMYAGAFSLCMNLVMLALPLYSLQVLDRVLSSHSLETLALLTLLTVVCLLVYTIFSVVRDILLNAIGEWLDIEISPKLFADAVSKSSIGISVNASQHQRDLATIRGFITSAAGTLLDAPWSVVYLLVMYMINPVLGFITVVGLIALIGFGILNELFTRKIFEQSSKEQIKAQIMADTASRNAEAIESMGMMRNVLRVWEEHQGGARDYARSGARRAGMIQAISRFIRLVIQIAITGVGGYLALENELSVGGMIASSIIAGRALAPFENAIAIWKNWIATRESYHRVNKALLSGQAIGRGTVDLPEPEGRINVENLIFTPPNSAPIIKGVTFNLQPGQSLGIIGPSAAGKSTLAKLIVGLLPPNHGAARLDGMETFKWSRENFGKYVGYMPQSVDMFQGTIKDNIARMDKNASIEAVIEAAKMAQCHELILRQPNGYETVVAPNLNNLSPGQRQRIGLARALYGRPKFVVLDEPNSNLDGDGERALLMALRSMKEAGITFIVVAHRPSIVQNVDGLLVLKGGVIERFGATADVLRAYQADPENNPTQSKKSDEVSS
ncbi:MAG: type I secretion system permease/ATPase [Alphaproteobacteria bacterium]|nr:MAG: type I secretion system permease/ATPase [Alphaproteobacteria bacterium]